MPIPTGVGTTLQDFLPLRMPKVPAIRSAYCQGDKWICGFLRGEKRKTNQKPNHYQPNTNIHTKLPLFFIFNLAQCFLIILQKARATEKKTDRKDHQKGCQQQNFRGAARQHSQKKPDPRWHLWVSWGLGEAAMKGTGPGNGWFEEDLWFAWQEQRSVSCPQHNHSP